MDKSPIQSNLPEFGQSSMTSERLYQHPEPKQSVAKEITKNLAAWMVLFSLFFGLSVMILHAAEKQSAYQAEAISKAVGANQ